MQTHTDTHTKSQLPLIILSHALATQAWDNETLVNFILHVLALHVLALL